MGVIQANPEAIEKIREVLDPLPGRSEIYLFGSRALGTARSNSDFDLLVISKDELSLRERARLSSTYRLLLAHQGIDADIIVKSKNDLAEYRFRVGSVVKEALDHGIAL
ncbi:MAG: nucleotidyltransferase domain-containing protein [Spirochaetales bacterium]|nr:nucleotidyltransferase domain-containing protein [Spirochaetales bacterium]